MSDLRGQDERGGLLLGVLLVLLVLIVATIGVVKTDPSLVGGSKAGSTSTLPGSASSGRHVGMVSATAVAACRSSYQAVQAAVDAFETETGTGPTSIKQLQSLLHVPVVTAGYTIGIDRSLAGEIDVATPGHSASPGNANCAFAGE